MPTEAARVDGQRAGLPEGGKVGSTKGSHVLVLAGNCTKGMKAGEVIFNNFSKINVMGHEVF